MEKKRIRPKGHKRKEGDMRKRKVRVPEKRKDLPPPMQQEYDRFVGWLEGPLCISPVTINTTYTPAVISFMLWMNDKRGHLTIQGARAAEIAEWMAWMPQRNIGTIKGIRGAMKKLLQWMYLNGYCGYEEVMRFDMVKVSTNRHYKSKSVRALMGSEVAEIFRNINEKWPYDPEAVDRLNRGIKLSRPMTTKLRKSLHNVQNMTLIMTFLDTGGRVEEITDLSINDVDPKNDTIPLLGKNDKLRYIPYSSRLKEQMRIWLAHRALVVPRKGPGSHDMLWISVQRFGETMSVSGIDRRVQAIYDNDIDAGVHILRKTFATVNYKAGMDIGVLSKLMGHESIRTTQVYLGITQEDVNAEAKLFEGARWDFIDKQRANAAMPIAPEPLPVRPSTIGK